MALSNIKSNKDLLDLIQKDDKVAFYQLYERYCRKLYAFTLKYIKRKEDAEEIVQEIFIRIWEHRNTIDINSSFESFLFTIAYNVNISFLRKKSYELKYIEYLKSIQHIENADDLVEKIHFNDLNDKIQSLLNKLTPRQREIFKLSREKGLSHGEIAKILNISVNTVKKHMANILAYLKSHIDKYLIFILLLVFAFLF